MFNECAYLLFCQWKGWFLVAVTFCHADNMKQGDKKLIRETDTGDQLCHLHWLAVLSADLFVKHKDQAVTAADGAAVIN